MTIEFDKLKPKHILLIFILSVVTQGLLIGGVRFIATFGHICHDPELTNYYENQYFDYSFAYPTGNWSVKSFGTNGWRNQPHLVDELSCTTFRKNHRMRIYRFPTNNFALEIIEKKLYAITIENSIEQLSSSQYQTSNYEVGLTEQTRTAIKFLSDDEVYIFTFSEDLTLTESNLTVIYKNVLSSFSE